jgi:hypothetical protein
MSWDFDWELSVYESAKDGMGQRLILGFRLRISAHC